MPHFFLYLAKVNIALLVFCAGYYLVLRRLTFYTLNRIYLVGAILFASIYPKINLSYYLQRHPHMAEPVQAIAYRIQVSPKQLIGPITHHGYWQYAEFIFWIGVILLALKLLVQFISLYRIYSNSSEGLLHGYKVRLIKGDGGPFSFWKNIYVNPDQHEPADLKSILQHEQVHVSEWHTADILLAELSTIFYWFNPGIWLMKKAIRENIEFITDRKIIQNGADSKQYQYSLVNVSFAAAPQGIVNHFNISTIKKRIIMMNAKRSSKLKLTRYAFLIPAVIVLLLIVTVSRAALVKQNNHYPGPVAAIKTEMSKAFARARQSAKLISSRPKEQKPTTADTTKPKKQVTIAPAADTNKNKKLHLSLNNGKLVIEDPSMFIVDGMITEDYDISKVDTADIVSINVGRLADGKSVVYVQTKNGMPARAVKAIRINGKAAENLRGVTINGKVTVIDTLRLADGKIKLDTVFVTGRGRLTTNAYKVEPFKNVYKVQPFNGRPLAIQPSGLKVNAKQLNTVYTAGLSDYNEVSLSHLSDKLIVINGNIASKSDLKKLSAFDIDRLVLKTDDETKELYGDRAKNGVVFIVTRKK